MEQILPIECDKTENIGQLLCHCIDVSIEVYQYSDVRIVIVSSNLNIFIEHIVVQCGLRGKNSLPQRRNNSTITLKYTAVNKAIS